MLDSNLHLINVLPWSLDGVLGGFDWTFDLVFAPFDQGVVDAGKRTSGGLTMILVIGYPSPIGPFPGHCPLLRRIVRGLLVLRKGGPTHRRGLPWFPSAALESSGLHPSIGFPLHMAYDLDPYKTPIDLPFWAVVHKFGPPSILH